MTNDTGKEQEDNKEKKIVQKKGSGSLSRIRNKDHLVHKINDEWINKGRVFKNFTNIKKIESKQGENRYQVLEGFDKLHQMMHLKEDIVQRKVVMDIAM